MSTFFSLLVAVLPLSLVAAVSPVIFLNSSSVLGRGGVPAGLRFLGGNALVLLALGVASMGLLGASAASAAEREIASRAVDRVLGLLLFCYGAYLLVQLVRKATRPPSPQTPAVRGEFSWGALGMLTNFTTLPVYMSLSQRIGAAELPLVVRAVILLFATSIVLTPAWLPIVLRKFSAKGQVLSERSRKKISDLTQIISVAACLIGAAFLVLHGF